MDYPHSIEKVFRKLGNAGYQAFLVGGCVRDHLLGKTVSDFDIATDALPPIVQRIFADCPQYDSGIKHGTITIIMDKEPVEITTFRQDGKYSDSRRPDHVDFTSDLCDDLMRRDFTINAMAFSPSTGLVDPFGGRSDLQNKILRAVGDPLRRFSEDGLRILRAVRFASQLDFSIEENTFRAMRESLPILKKISAERKWNELIKTLTGKAIFRVLTEYPEIFAALVPEVEKMKGFDQNNPHHVHDVLTHTAHVIEYSPADKETRLAAFFHDMGKVYTYSESEDGIGHFYGHAKISCQIADRVLHEFKSDKETIRQVLKLVQYHDSLIEPSSRAVKRWLNRFGENLFFKLLDLKLADNLAQAPEYSSRADTIRTIREIAEEILAQEECFSLKDLAVDGKDMIRLGLCGKAIGDALQSALHAVIDEKIANEPSELIRWIKNNYIENEK